MALSQFERDALSGIEGINRDAGAFGFGGFGFSDGDNSALRAMFSAEAAFAAIPTEEELRNMSILDVILDTAKDAGQSILRTIIPDPLEVIADVFFPDTARTVLGDSPFVLPSGGFRLPGSIPGTTGGTPPFFPSPLEPEISSPAPFVIPELPGIFDDLVRAGVDLIGDLIPGIGEIDVSPGPVFDEDVSFEEVGEQFPEIFDPFEDPSLPSVPSLEFPIEGDFGVVQPEDFEMAEGDLVTCPPRQRLPNCLTVQQWSAAGRPDGYVMDRGGFLRKKRHRRRRPLSQQAKDDLAWAKATFGSGKAFDNVVARMRL